jgi:hypothetical protein
MKMEHSAAQKILELLGPCLKKEKVSFGFASDQGYMTSEGPRTELALLVNIDRIIDQYRTDK